MSSSSKDEDVSSSETGTKKQGHATTSRKLSFKPASSAAHSGRSQSGKSRFKKRKSIIGMLGLVVIIVIVFPVYFILRQGDANDSESSHYICPYSNQSALGEICSPSPLGQYKHYAVSTDSNVCASTGKRIMADGGNAVDAAIGVLLCMGVTIPESLGLGGGSLTVIYNATSKQSTFINARETAPNGATRDMFNGTGKPNNRASFGIEAIAVPGELAGIWHLYQHYGSKKVTWNRLFADAINYSRNGFPLGHHFNDALEQNRKYIMKLAPLYKVYVNPATKDLYKVNEIIKQPALADTLEKLANSNKPMELFYMTIAKKILNDIQAAKGDFPDQNPVIGLHDFQKYTVKEEQSFTHQFPNFKLHTCGLPGAGVLLSFCLRVMAKYPDLYPGAKSDPEKAALFFHRLTETFKFSFAARMYLGEPPFDDVTKIVENLQSEKYIEKIVKKIDDIRTYPSSSGYYDPNTIYNEPDKGTAHLATLDSEGNAVSITSTVNHYFGSKFLSTSTGILMNNEMDDFNSGLTNEFDLPASYANTIHRGKRPLSSMSPAIFTDDTGVRLVVGASGGPKIFPSVAYTSLRHLWFGDTIKQSIDSCRVHDQLFPEKVVYEPGFSKDILRGMKDRGHNLTQLPKDVRGAVVMGISRSREGEILANSDYRKGGTVDGE